jgi:hypothetical protein
VPLTDELALLQSYTLRVQLICKELQPVRKNPEKNPLPDYLRGELSHAGHLAMQNTDSKASPESTPGVGSSDLVGVSCIVIRVSRRPRVANENGSCLMQVGEEWTIRNTDAGGSVLELDLRIGVAHGSGA